MGKLMKPAPVGHFEVFFFFLCQKMLSTECAYRMMARVLTPSFFLLPVLVCCRPP